MFLGSYHRFYTLYYYDNSKYAMFLCLFVICPYRVVTIRKKIHCTMPNISKAIATVLICFLLFCLYLGLEGYFLA